MTNQLDYAKELKLLSDEQQLLYNKSVDELFLRKTNFQTYHNLDAMLFNILTGETIYTFNGEDFTCLIFCHLVCMT